MLHGANDMLGKRYIMGGSIATVAGVGMAGTKGVVVFVDCPDLFAGVRRIPLMKFLYSTMPLDG